MSVNKMKFWGKQYLDNLVIIVSVALLLIVFLAVGGMEISDGVGNLFLEGLALFPYYLCFSASFVVLMVGVGYFQSYFPVLVSMNLTRKSVVNGIMLCMFAVILTVLLISAVIWNYLPMNKSEMNAQLFWLFGGVQLAAASFSMLCGYVIARWQKIGTIVLTSVCLLVGGSVGASVSVFENVGLVEIFVNLVEKYKFTWLFALGLALYAAVGIFIRVSTKKLEIRM